MANATEIFLLGVSFRTAPVAVRESLSFNRTEAISLLRFAAREHPGIEATVLSTCNRTEFYLAGAPDSRIVERWMALLKQFRPDARVLHSECHRYHRIGNAAARHLFRVAGGLESAILGDSQILGQVRQAVALAGGSGTLGISLQTLFAEASRAGRQARRETAIGRGAASLGSAISGLLAERDGASRGGGSLRRIVLIGAGEIARDIGRHLAKGTPRELVFINRTLEKAESLAEDCGGRAEPWESLDDALESADCVIAATACQQPILAHSLLSGVQARRAGRPLLVIDAGVPRNVEPGSACELIDIDAIRERQESALKARRDAVPAVEQIVEEAVWCWTAWLALRPLEASLKSLYAEADAICEGTFSETTDWDDAARSRATHGLRRLMKRSLRDHARAIRSAGRGSRFNGGNSNDNEA
jgi:glutamyl-tRNA reductase